MEVLKTDNKLKEEIINDAKVKADRIIKKAKTDAEEIEKNSLDQIGQIEEDFKKAITREIEVETKKIFASVEIDVKKKNLDIIGKLLDEVFDNVKKLIEDNKFTDYKQFMMKLIQNASLEMKSSSYIIEVGKKELAKLSKDSLQSLKLTGGSVKEIVEKDVEGLLLLSENRRQGVFISLDDFINRLKEDERIKVYEILVKGEE